MKHSPWKKKKKSHRYSNQHQV